MLHPFEDASILWERIVSILFLILVLMNERPPVLILSLLVNISRTVERRFLFWGEGGTSRLFLSSGNLFLRIHPLSIGPFVVPFILGMCFLTKLHFSNNVNHLESTE